MSDEDNLKMLIIRHMPNEFNSDDRSKLFKYLGAVTVKTFTRGPMKNVVFATFDDCETAKHVLQVMHQYEIFGRRISVEYAKPIHESYHNTKCIEQEPTNINTATPRTIPEELKHSNWIKRLLALAPSLGVNCPMKSSLQYSYPEPNPAILTNIARALAVCPAFYTQVIHLMNKMNLPNPFGSDVIFPGSIDLNCQVHLDNEEAERNVEMEIESSTNESEMASSDSDSSKLKKKVRTKTVRRLPDLPRVRPVLKKTSASRKRKLSAVDSSEQDRSSVSIQEAFDSSNVAPQSKQIQLKLPDTRITQWTDVTQENIHQDEAGVFGKISKIDIQPEHSEKTLVEEVPDVEEDETEQAHIVDFIDPDELLKCRLSSPERAALSVFKNYREGEPSCRLYVKNLSRSVTDMDLKQIYAGFVDWTDKTQRQQFDVRLFTEGRMKGQAFITLGSEDAACRALTSSNGYLLHDKPMVVQFARGAKAKVDEKSLND